MRQELNEEQWGTLTKNFGPKDRIVLALLRRPGNGISVKEVTNIGWGGYASRECIYTTMRRIRIETQNLGIPLLGTYNNYEIKIDRSNLYRLRDILSRNGRLLLALSSMEPMGVEELKNISCSNTKYIFKSRRRHTRF